MDKGNYIWRLERLIPKWGSPRVLQYLRYLKTINFPFVPKGKLMVLSILVFKQNSIFSNFC